MKAIFRYSASVLAATMALTMGTAAWAQDSEDDAAESPTDIVVTARRVEERLQDVPISITVFNQEQLGNRNVAVASDLATYTPSLSTNTRFGPEKATFAIRGFNQDASTAPTVGVYFADVVGTRAQGGTAGGNTVGAGSFTDLQNVQVLKGPQGTLFGRNTTGGAILLVPKRPTS
ncbi:MAG: TonB-dependent receptor plug domain-containing protein, partial [Novosphingobium sp.]